MLRGSELKLIEALNEEVSVTELANRLEKSPSYTSELVTRAEEHGLVRTRRDGRKKLASAADTKPVELFQRLVQTYPHVDFPDLLTGKTLACIYYLDQPLTVADLATRTGDYRNTVNRVVNRLLHRGILRKHDSKYQLNEDFETLHEFVTEYVHHRHRQTAARHTLVYTILWESLREFLVQTSDPITATTFLPTGPRRFQEHGVPLLTTDRYHYLYSETRERITVPDLICHTLLIDDGTRYQTYCLLLLSLEDPDCEALQNTAEYYGVTTTIETLLTYIHTKGEAKTPALPEWHEFETTAAEYGIHV